MYSMLSELLLNSVYQHLYVFGRVQEILSKDDWDRKVVPNPQKSLIHHPT